MSPDPAVSCKIGGDGLAVLDLVLRVHGIERLRVDDASVLPLVTNSNINASV